MNWNDEARVITSIEGKLKGVSIAQVKEILAIIADRRYSVGHRYGRDLLAYGISRSRKGRTKLSAFNKAAEGLGLGDGKRKAKRVRAKASSRKGKR